MIRVAICDDDISFTGHLEHLLMHTRDCWPTQELDVDVFFSGEKLCAAMQKAAYYDVLFLDIQMVGMSGIDVGKHLRNALRNHHTLLVYVSSYETYHKSLYPLSPSAFISKPIQEEELHCVISLLIRKLRENKATFMIKTGGASHKIIKADVMYFESQKRKMLLYTLDSVYEFYQSVEVLLQRLEDQDFVRIHKSYVVNLNRVATFTAQSFLMENGGVLPIGPRFTKVVKEKVAEYLSRKRIGYV